MIPGDTLDLGLKPCLRILALPSGYFRCRSTRGSNPVPGSQPFKFDNSLRAPSENGLYANKEATRLRQPAH